MILSAKSSMLELVNSETSVFKTSTYFSTFKIFTKFFNFRNKKLVFGFSGCAGRLDSPHPRSSRSSVKQDPKRCQERVNLDIELCRCYKFSTIP